MATTELVPPNWRLPEYFKLRLGSTVGRQRLMHRDGQLLIVAHQVPGSDEKTRRGILFWYDENQQWHASNGDSGKVAIESLIGKYMQQIEEFDRHEEKAQNAADYLPLLEGLAPVARAARHFYEVLQEARKTASDVRELIDLRNRAYDMMRTVELLYQDAKNSMEVAVVRRAEEQAIASHNMSVASHRLNTMAAIFLPLATLGSIFGTTLTDNWRWSDSPIPFLSFVVIGLGTGLGLAVFVNRSAQG